MFQKKKRSFYAIVSREGETSFSSSSGERKVKSDDILHAIEEVYKRDGKVVIDFMDEQEIHITSLKTVQDSMLEAQLNSIKSLIKNHLKKGVS